MWGAVARGVGSAVVGEVAVNLALNSKGFSKGVNQTIKSTENSFGSSFKKISGMIASAFAIGKVVQFGKASLDAAKASQSAWTGLYSIVDGTGKSFADAKGFIEDYISDGLVPLENATTAYKNLAARGYSTEQIEGVMTSLKDAAAFGRQASYSLGDAITSATEGLKNENSILVDNAGVTKNVAKMWDEYAKSIGTTANNLTQQQKIQAEVNGIIEETKFQTGDAATYTKTYAGRTAQLSTAFLNLKTAVGKVVGPIASAFIPVLVNAMNVMTKFFNKVQQLLSVFGFKWQDVVTKNTANSISGIGDSASNTADSIGSIGDSASSTAKKLKRAFGSMDEINVLNTNASDSSSGSGSSGLGGVGSADGGVSGFYDNAITEDPISPQIKKIADKIKEYLEPLKKISFDNLTKSFKKLKKSLEPITKKLFEGLDWAYYNIFVPLATWTIEDLIPAFLNATSGALDYFNGVMDYAQPYLQFFWEEFLQPIAKWTGGVVVSVLNNIGDGLSKIGAWLSDNKTDIKAVREELGPWAKMLQEMGKFLGNILGLAWDKFQSRMEKLWNIVLKPVWDYFLKPILSNYWDKLNKLYVVLGNIFETTNLIMEGDYKGAGQSIVKGLTDGVKDFKGGWVYTNILEPIKTGLSGLWTTGSTKGTELKNGLSSGIGNMKTWATTKANEIATGLGGLWSQGKTKGTELLNGIKNGASSAKSWATTLGKNIVSGISSGLSTLGSGIKNIFKGAMNGAIGVVETALNWIIKQMNKLSWNIPDWVPKIGGNKFGFNFKTISIPRLAQGGWVPANNPQLAIVGDNRREGEIIAPESKIYDQVSQAIKDSGSAGNQQLEITIYHKYEDGKTIIQKVNQAQIDAGKVLLMT